ncbi:hypothetical protein HY409_04185 [Candidatus Gottesmanbacteria bacterium]|nr:hypothetical protein [Candidatus Gottesmanbacteria bacterium]
MAKKIHSSSFVPYTVVAVVLVFGVAVFIKLFTGNSSSDVLGMYTMQPSASGNSMTLGDKISSFFRGTSPLKKPSTLPPKKTRRVDVERKQRVGEWIKEIDGIVDDGGTLEFQALQKDANSL